MALLKTFLLLVAAFVTAIVLLVLLLLLWLRLKLRSFAKSIDNFASLGTLILPFRVTLAPAEEPEWNLPDEVDQVSTALEEAGFRRAGDFEADELPGVVLRALSDPQRRIDAVIYDDSQAGVGFDLACRYTDGRIVTYATRQPSGLANPPFVTIEHHPGAEPQELLEHCLATRPEGDLESTPPEQFRDRFYRAYAREMDWRAERGGPSEDEIRAMYTKLGHEADPKLIAGIRATWQAQITEHLDEQLREAFLNQGSISARRWEEIRERLFFVHDRLSEAELLDPFEIALVTETEKAGAFAGDDHDDEEDEDAFERELGRRRKKLRRAASGLPPRQAFAAMNETISPDQRCERIGEMNEPLPADVYLQPEDS